jgi:hypothetical protein
MIYGESSLKSLAFIAERYERLHLNGRWEEWA